jgi:hypothetical protein
MAMPKTWYLEILDRHGACAIELWLIMTYAVCDLQFVDNDLVQKASIAVLIFGISNSQEAVGHSQ